MVVSMLAVRAFFVRVLWRLGARPRCSLADLYGPLMTEDQRREAEESLRRLPLEFGMIEDFDQLVARWREHQSHAD